MVQAFFISLRPMKQTVFLIFFSLLALGCKAQETWTSQTEVLVVGGGASGTAAAIQASRLGVQVIIAEPTTWLGGMLTAAGVSAVDGNHKMPSGIFGEFREELYRHYGGPSKVATGWVSNTLFEPHVGDSLLKMMVAKEKGIIVLYQHHFKRAIMDGDRIVGAEFEDSNGNLVRIGAKMVIEATEYGDVLASAGAGYDTGMETFAETGEPGAPEEKVDFVQDLTYVAILEDYGKGQNKTIPKPEPYNTEAFDCMCAQVCDIPQEGLIDCQQMLNYGKLPNNKYMINWPNKGNDLYLDILELSQSDREEALKAAKNHTLSWVYFLQTKGNFKHIGLATDEFGTPDHLALIPYIRESRRLQGKIRLKLQDILDPYADPARPYYQFGIAVGDYPVDHHRKVNPVPRQIEFPPIPSYNVPYGVMLPDSIKGLIVAEKSISVTNVVNGTTRLQPVVLGLGQAAGAAAALSINNTIDPVNLPIRLLQQTLIDASVWIMPYFDVKPNEPEFAAIMRVGAAGLMRGEGRPVAWANETLFKPDSIATAEDLHVALSVLGHKSRLDLRQNLSYGLAISELEKLSGEVIQRTQSEGKMLTRRQLAVLLDTTIKPFSLPTPRLWD
jgi:hypothetical protein